MLKTAETPATALQQNINNSMMPNRGTMTTGGTQAMVETPGTEGMQQQQDPSNA
jgi:hypothetical protein